MRRGDIVEWRKVKVRMLDGSGWTDLGSPDHTAIIVDVRPTTATGHNANLPNDQQPFAPWQIGTIEVIEQSKGKIPSRASYNLQGMQSGEIYIYRPAGMREYVGIDGLSPDWDSTVSRGTVMSV